MKWIKKGLIFSVDRNYEWMQTHASVPTVDKVTDDRLRVYFGTRDVRNFSFTTFIEIETDNPSNVLSIHDKAVLSPGPIGAFDDCGAIPSWIVNHKGRKYLYYIGWNVRNTVPYHNSIGLAVSLDNGTTFKKLSDGPIIDRNSAEPYFSASSCVFVEDGLWRMWYLSCVKWSTSNGRPEPYYHIKYAESKDGVNWKRAGKVCIDFKDARECAIARPCVVKDSGQYKMWYSYRNLENYRTDTNNSYRIGYAESRNGIDWIRKDSEVGISVSPDGWDSQMMEYAYVYECKSKRYMFYNGNGFGKSGFGYALLEKKRKA